jgi:hypothetical protein
MRGRWEDNNIKMKLGEEGFEGRRFRSYYKKVNVSYL